MIGPDISQEEKDRMGKIIHYLVVEIGINPFDKMELLLLARAIEYANPNLWKENVETLADKMNKEIFLTKAYHYFKRKRLNMLEDLELFKQIERREHHEVSMIKFKYMTPNVNP